MRNRRLVLVLSKALFPSLDHRPLHRRLFASSACEAGGGGVSVKKVTRSNFDSALEDLRVRVREADFVAIDLEMTGLTSAPWRDPFEYDRSDVRYLKVKDSAEKFAVVQFGVCPFRWEPSKASFLAHPHNFYIFPRKELPIHGPSYEFLCQTTSLDFLAKYQFDFNACIREGISYLSRKQEAEAMKNLTSAYVDGLANSFYNLGEHVEIPIISTSDLLFTERMKNRFSEWRNMIVKDQHQSCSSFIDPGGARAQFPTTFYKMRPAVTLEGFTSHQLKLIELVLRKNFTDLVYVHLVDQNLTRQSQVVYVDTQDDKAHLMREIKDDIVRNAEARVNSAAGLRHVMDLLASEGKLIVGHNCFLDVAHIYSKFFGPLPSTMMEFVLAVHDIFPCVIDTKHLMNSVQTIQFLMRKSSKSLSSAFSVLCPYASSKSECCSSNSFVKFEVQEDDNRLSSFNSGAKHEAGYDAFMTGCVFAQACSHLGVKFQVYSSSLDLARNDKIQNYINFLYPSGNSGTVINLSTGKESQESGYKRKYPKVMFENIIILWGFSSKLKSKEMMDCICKEFGPNSVTSIFFLDSTAALIQFTEEQTVNKFLVLKDTLERSVDPLSVLHPLAKLWEGGMVHAADYDTYKEICGASSSKVLFADQADTLGFSWKTKVKSTSGDIHECTSNNDDITEDNPSELEEFSGRKINLHKISEHHISWEGILDSLCASRSVSSKRMRT